MPPCHALLSGCCREPPPLRSHKALRFFQEPGRARSLLANHSQKPITSFYPIAPGQEQSHKKRKPRNSSHLCTGEKSNPNLCCSAGRSQSQAPLLGAFPPPLVQLHNTAARSAEPCREYHSVASELEDNSCSPNGAAENTTL